MRSQSSTAAITELDEAPAPDQSPTLRQLTFLLAIGSRGSGFQMPASARRLSNGALQTAEMKKSRQKTPKDRRRDHVGW